MNNILNKIIVFTAGAAIGSVITWNVVKNKYEQLIEEEIDSVKEAYEKNYSKLLNSNNKETETPIEEVEEYKNIVNNYNTESNNDKEEEDNIMDMPYLISPEEFADSDYETASLWYFADGILTDEQYNIIEDVDETVGYESLEHFGDYSDDPDTVYVRNDYLEVDYEICRDERIYSEICE